MRETRALVFRRRRGSGQSRSSAEISPSGSLKRRSADQVPPADGLFLRVKEAANSSPSPSPRSSRLFPPFASPSHLLSFFRSPLSIHLHLTEMFPLLQSLLVESAVNSSGSSALLTFVLYLPLFFFPLPLSPLSPPPLDLAPSSPADQSIHCFGFHSLRLPS